MRVLFVEGKDLGALRELARGFPHPYRLLYRPEQGLYLLEVWGYAPGLEAAVSGLEGFRSWSFELLEEGSRLPAADARGD
ncbi:MAG: hypothetical protein NZ849_10415 [Meiothermus sp.]|uniref:hypothetical protein n=1 Tax=Meiothermus sp. TaxID=1955249 RepID=UPI002600A4F0|nr:hypothetical protein [Meiothermus sp.]MCS7058545.1 hypothetical protein [Meiothermus sp.]MCS7195302.1 hypothetical protein [Meiothermus sp.]MDW8091647.1 hypothetical protein [Meiothermus sp.]MDW8480962.1 hypothetical protein [Meiothermus sp.]